MIVKPGTAHRALTVALVVAGIGGCSAPKETARITERAPVQRVASTERAESAVAQARAPRVTPQSAPDITDVTSGRFDGGKMWTFDDPPIDYFDEEYDFRPGTRWFDKARLSALRFSTYCSASFVSATGLVMTNHHCGRESISKVSKPGEDLLDNGFYAETLEAERRVDNLFVDQLVQIADVTDEVYRGFDFGSTPEQQVAARESRRSSIETKMTDAVQKQDTLLSVEVVELYNGGKYSAYTFRKYNDVRLVMAPELEIGFFGGDWDNFTYPRYVLDMSFFRVYGPDGQPLKTDNYFQWSASGAEDGETTFVIGNPGSTSRLSTVAQLEFERDVSLPQALRVIRTRSEILKSFIAANPIVADSLDLRNTYFSLENTLKANTGQLNGLQDAELMQRKAAGEAKLAAAIRADSSATAFVHVLDAIAEIQVPKRAVAQQSGAFTYFSSDVMTSHILIRGLYGYIADLLKQRGAPDERIAEMKNAGLAVSNWPSEVEKGFITARLEEVRDYLTESHPSVRALLRNGTPESIAADIVEGTALADSASFAEILEKGFLSSGDVAVPVVQSLAELYFSLGQQRAQFEDREKNLNAELGRAQYAVYGTDVPPDASFSLRIADGRMADYRYNGTKAPLFTTFYGLFDRFSSFRGQPEWDLPERWQLAATDIDLSTPLNIVSTNDITGGNSGSPLLNKNLEVVGLVFDSNIEALPNEYLYRDDAGRTVSVDSRGIIEALKTVYKADRIVDELTTTQE